MIPWCLCRQIFNGVAFLLGLLGVLVIYALVLGNVEGKTYECAPPHRVSLVSRQAAVFACVLRRPRD